MFKSRLATSVSTGLLAGSLMLALPAWAETLTGKINGHDCAEAGTACPVDRLDPHITLERDFVLQKADGDYYFLTNIARDLKVRYVLEDVQVTGRVNKRYNSVRVNEFRVKKDGGWKTVWSPQLEAQSWQEINTRTNQ